MCKPCNCHILVIPETRKFTSLDLNYWRLALSKCESTNSRSIESVGSCKLKRVKVVFVKENGIVEKIERNEIENMSDPKENSELDLFQMYENFPTVLYEGNDLRMQFKVVEHIRYLLKDDEEGRIFMGTNGFVEALVRFLGLVVHEHNEKAVEFGVRYGTFQPCC
uniref:Uncharacterized protein n=1 Tax=Nelumbo nucifera TaxID=4432 RepID=A0A822X900_NELNU|nr:TPA_asm: hypothetical protein HUJ06_019387 [Nelumbo nucifera]